MFSIYVGELFKRVFFPTTRGADYMSVLVPLALAGAVFFRGVKVTDAASTEILAYLGLFTAASFLMRLFVTGPYVMWKDESVKVGDLMIELSRPERRVLEHLAKHRAKSRAKIAELLEDMANISFAEGWEGFAEKRFVEYMSKIQNLQAKTGLSEAFNIARIRYSSYLRYEANQDNNKMDNTRRSRGVLDSMHKYLMGEITGEVLLLRLPQDTES